MNNLSDQEILELTDLCNAVVDDTITAKQQARLSQRLASSEGARAYYVRLVGLSASLHQYAAELQTEEPEAVVQRSNLVHLPFARWLVPLAAAAVLVLAFLVTHSLRQPGGKSIALPNEAASEEFVAQLTGAKDSKWAAFHPSFQLGDHLRRGQRLELLHGYAEITFDSGAQVFLEAPVAIDVISAWHAALRRGAIKASVPPEAIGFSIVSEAVKVVDLGTEFTMYAGVDGIADVLVLKGEVEATPRGTSSQDSIFLRENEARRFGRAGITEVRDDDLMFTRFTQPVSLERFTPSITYVRWTLDEADGNVLPADSFGTRMPAFDARLEAVSESGLTDALVAGRWNGALRFNGQLFARAPFRGMSGNSPHTVAFWVKIPEGAQLSSAYAMVAWWADSVKLGPRPVHISWNRNPNEGPIGVLRTDYGGGYALGATPLRDGRWHHVAVVFVPGERGAPVEVKQYVDGRLEGEGRPSPTRGDVSLEVAESVKNAVWLGCRLGSSGPRRDRFRGEIDELCVADLALSPHQIVHLMRQNRPLNLEVVAAENQPRW